MKIENLMGDIKPPFLEKLSFEYDEMSVPNAGSVTFS